MRIDYKAHRELKLKLQKCLAYLEMLAAYEDDEYPFNCAYDNLDECNYVRPSELLKELEGE